METLFVLVLVSSVALWVQAVMRALRSVSPPAQRRVKQEAERPEEARQERERILKAKIESLRPAAREWVEGAWRSVEARDFQRQSGVEGAWRSEEARDFQRQSGFVYLVRNGDLYKIGITQNVQRRMTQLKPDKVLKTVRCSNFKEVERQLHARFKKVRIPQSEYFRLNNAQIQQVLSELAANEVY